MYEFKWIDIKKEKPPFGAVVDFFTILSPKHHIGSYRETHFEETIVTDISKAFSRDSVHKIKLYSLNEILYWAYPPGVILYV